MLRSRSIISIVLLGALVIAPSPAVALPKSEALADLRFTLNIPVAVGSGIVLLPFESHTDASGMNAEGEGGFATTSSGGNWVTDNDGKTANYSLAGFTADAIIIGATIDYFALAQGTVTARFNLANLKDTAVTFPVTASWTPQLSVTTEIPGEAFDIISLLGFASYGISVRDPNGNIPTGWNDSSGGIGFPQDPCCTPGKATFQFTVLNNSSRSLTVRLDTQAGVRITLPEPASFSLLAWGMILLASCILCRGSS